jgi:UDP-N-acetyl-D-mannosaminuronic acid dehydrogenase
LNVWEVIELANRHPRVNILQPGPGVGGHCIAVDPYFIIDAAPDSTDLMRTARKINAARPSSIVADIVAMADSNRVQTVACLGLSYKPNIDDMRESPAVEVVRLLAGSPRFRIVAAEPNVKALPAELADAGVILTDALSAIDQADIVVLLVDHRQFGLIDPVAFQSKKLVDTRGLWTWRKARQSDARVVAEEVGAVERMTGQAA